MKNLNTSEQRCGDLAGHCVTGGGNCVFSISYSVPHQPQHYLGMSSTIMAVDLCTHYETRSQLVELSKKWRARAAPCGCAEGLLPVQQGSCSEQVGFQVKVDLVYGFWATGVQKAMSTGAVRLSSHSLKAARGTSESTSVLLQLLSSRSSCPLVSGRCEWQAQREGNHPGGSDCERAGGTCRLAGSFGQTELSCGL